MAWPRTLIDTDILSAIMRQETRAVDQARGYLADHVSLTISIITRYEILRGLKAKNAAKQISAFHSFCRSLEIIHLSDSIVVRASDIYGDLHRRGDIIGDADILIAATALEHRLQIATNNEGHFARISGLDIHNWLAK